VYEMQHGAKTIQIFLPDGNPRGIKIVEVTNRTVQAILIPRALLEQAKIREEVSSVGLYFLFGDDEEQLKPAVYIGEAECGYHRLKQHHKEKEFWQTAILVVTNNKQNQFTKSDVKFLENLSYERAKEANRFSLQQTIPTKSFVPEWRQADLNDIFETVQLLLSTLGYPVFDSLSKPIKEKEIKKEELSELQEELFYCEAKGVKASGYPFEDGFVILKGSEMVAKPVPSFVERYAYHITRIEKMKEEGIVALQDGTWVFQSDFLASSPSMAACIITQRASNGWTDWKDASGKSLDELKRK